VPAGAAEGATAPGVPLRTDGIGLGKGPPFTGVGRFNLPLNGSKESKSPDALADEPVIPLGNVAPKVSIARRTPVEQRANASKKRGLKMPDEARNFEFRDGRSKMVD